MIKHDFYSINWTFTGFTYGPTPYDLYTILIRLSSLLEWTTCAVVYTVSYGLSWSCTIGNTIIHGHGTRVSFFKSFKYHTRPSLIHSNSPSVTRIRPGFVRLYVLFDFINLTQVHNFMVSAQDLFTFRRLSVFTVRFRGILQVLMQIMKRFVTSYLLVKWL